MSEAEKATPPAVDVKTIIIEGKVTGAKDIMEAEQKNLPVKYTVTDKALAELKAKYSVVPDCTTKTGYLEAKEALGVLRPLRTGLEKERKIKNEDAQKHINMVNLEAKRIREHIEDLEKPIAEAKSEEDLKVAYEKKAKAERIEKIRERLDSLRIAPSRLPLNSERIKEALAKLDAIKPQEFEEFAEEAVIVCKGANTELNFMLKEAIENEETAEKLAKEKAEFEAEKAKEEAKLKEDQLKLDEHKAKHNAELKAKEDKLRKEREEIEAEKRKIQEDKDAIERDKVEKARLEEEAAAKIILEEIKAEKDAEEKKLADKARKAAKKVEAARVAKIKADKAEARKIAVLALNEFFPQIAEINEHILSSIENAKIPGVRAEWVD